MDMVSYPILSLYSLNLNRVFFACPLNVSFYKDNFMN